MSGDLLAVQGVTLRFGGLTAVDEVSFAVREGEILALIGPNGAGKTSLFNLITGLYEPSAGRIHFGGQRICHHWTPGRSLLTIAAALGGAVAALVVLNAQVLWRAGVIDSFSFGGSWRWTEAPGRMLEALTAQGFWWTLFPALLVAGLVIGGMILSFQRSRCTPDLVARRGIGRTFQNIRLFAQLSCRDNVLAALDARHPQHWLATALRLPAWRRHHAALVRAADDLLALVDLAAASDRAAASLPYGHQRRLEIARALAGGPRLLLLDEPAAGMNPTETAALMALIRRIRDRGVTVLLIEHDMRLVMGVSERIVVLHHGACLAGGTPEEIRHHPAVIEAYLGGGT